jgi:Ca2+-transporting ATPase
MRVVEGTIAGVAFNLRSKDSQQDDNNKPDNSDDEDADTSNLVDDSDVKSTEELIELFKKNEKIRDIFAESVAINSTAFEDGQEEDKKDKYGKNGQKDKKDKKKKDKSSNGENGHNDQSDENKDDDGPKFVGNKTESALLRMLEVDLADVRKQPFSKIRENADTVLLLPFSSDRKAMATVVKLSGEENKHRVYVKGAAEVVAGLCTKRAKLESGSDEETDDIDQEQIQKLVDGYAKRALRTIAMAYKDLDEWPPKDAGNNGEGDGKVSFDDIAKDLILLAIPGIEDPLREGVSKAVENCHIAGVSVKMCTGDNLLTAK